MQGKKYSFHANDPQKVFQIFSLKSIFAWDMLGPIQNLFGGMFS